MLRWLMKYPLPPRETDLSTLTVNEVMDKVKEFQFRWEHDHDISDLAPGVFLELMA